MTYMGACLDEFLFTSRENRQYLEQRRLYHLEPCPTYKCAGGCSYCILSSDTTTLTEIPQEVLLKALDEAADFGVKSLLWQGGDPLLYPPLFDMVEHLGQKGVGSSILTSGLISKQQAKRIARLTAEPYYRLTGVHLDTIDPQAYARVNDLPRTLELKIQGYRNLLEAGHPPEKVLPMVTVTRPIIETLEETMDWFVDEMGARAIGLCIFKPCGFGDRDPGFEPSLSDVERVQAYRVKKLGPDWLPFRGGGSLGNIFCRTSMCLLPDGDVLPCGALSHLVIGNIHHQSIREIFESHRDLVTFNHEIQGQCGHCEHNWVCIGCRGSAYVYLGDMWAEGGPHFVGRGPKCPLNPEAKEVYLRQA